jgi:FkbM family methyltransferase
MLTSRTFMYNFKKSLLFSIFLIGALFCYFNFFSDKKIFRNAIQFQTSSQPNFFVVKETKKVFNTLSNMRDCHFVEQYAQHGEDMVLLGIMKALIKTPIKKWKFLDIGANDPISCNNTYLLYKQGARGVLVEPIPYLQDRLSKTRPEDLLLKGAITDYKDGIGKFYINKHDGLSSLIKNQAVEYAKTYNVKGSFNQQQIDVPLFPINAVLEKYFKDGLDLLSIDIEGYDMSVLTAIDMEKIRPKFIIIEFQAKMNNGREKIIRYLSHKNYKLVFENSGDNGIFADKALLH